MGIYIHHVQHKQDILFKMCLLPFLEVEPIIFFSEIEEPWKD